MKVLAVNTFVAAILVVTVLFETLLVVVMVRVVAALPQKVVMTEAFLPTVAQIGRPTWRGNNNKWSKNKLRSRIHQHRITLTEAHFDLQVTK